MARVGRVIKEVMVRGLVEALQAQPDFFMASVGLLPGSEVDALRKGLRKVGARVQMLKRRLSLRVVEGLGLNGAGHDLLAGSVAFVIPGDDVLQTAKVLVTFAKKSEGRCVVRGGRIDGQLLGPVRIQELGDLPSKPQLLAQLIGMIEFPLSGLVWTIEGILGELAWVVEQAAQARAEPVPSQG